MTLDRKQLQLRKASRILGAAVHGLDARTLDEFLQSARELADRCDVLVIAGGDGTLSDAINAIDTRERPVAFLPLGTGNAMRHALGYSGGISDIARRIRQGKIRQYDLINCQGKRRALMLSVGIEGTIIRHRDKYLARGYTGLRTYLGAFALSYFGRYKRAAARITVDGMRFDVDSLLTLIVTKHPYYGFGMKIVPKARLDDRSLHILCLRAGAVTSSVGIVTSFIGGNRAGHYSTGTELALEFDKPMTLQIDGSLAWDAESFTFTVLPGALKMKC